MAAQPESKESRRAAKKAKLAALSNPLHAAQEQVADDNQRVTVAKLAVSFLQQNNITTLFCLPGVQNDPFFDELYDKKADIYPLESRHEQGCAYMALGAALATGNPQAFLVVPGPGFLNTAAALCTAYSLNAPVFAIVAAIPQAAIGEGYGLLHDIPNQLLLLQSLTKGARRICGGEDAAAILKESWQSMLDAGKPVGVEVPADVWRNPCPSQHLDDLAVAAPDTTVHADDDLLDKIEDTVELVRASKRPLIIVGRGAQDAPDEVRELSEKLTAPVACRRTGHGVVSARHSACINMPVAHKLWSTVDLVIAIGTRFQVPQMEWGVDDALKIVHIDINADELGRITEPTIGIQGDAKLVVGLLNEELENAAKEVEEHECPMCSHKKERREWRLHVGRVKEETMKSLRSELAPQVAWLDAIRAALPDDGILVDELTQIGYAAWLMFPVYKPRTFLSSGYQGTLGWGIATAIGAQKACMDRRVVSIAGDGGALYTINELATAVHHKIPVTVIVFNDNAFGNVKLLQKALYRGRTIASDLTSPDFCQLATAFGARGLRATTPAELTKQLGVAFSSSTQPTLIEVPVGDFPNPWPFILAPRVR